MNYSIDINADVGEGISIEKDLMPFLSSCSIACGGHAGDVDSIKCTAALAQENKVKIGAHPSFPDKHNFGRVPMEISRTDLLHSLKEQMFLFKKVLDYEGAQVHHIKPHGALYNLVAKDHSMAEVLIELVVSEVNNAKLYVPFNSVIASLAQKSGIGLVYEAFADRNYNADGTLVSRKNPNAVIFDETDALRHSVSIIRNSEVKCIDGTKKALLANTLCIHGDNPNALVILKHLHNCFPKYDIDII